MISCGSKDYLCPHCSVWDKYMVHKVAGPPQLGVITQIDAAGLLVLVLGGKEEKVSQC